MYTDIETGSQERTCQVANLNSRVRISIPSSLCFWAVILSLSLWNLVGRGKTLGLWYVL